ncbi:MAG: methyltransferase [Candidatus Anstonellales archaeon]
MDWLVFPNVYPPSEDTFMLYEELKKERGKMLEIGTGSGYIAINYAKKGYAVDACDIDKIAIENAKKNAEMNNVKNVHFFISNVFSNVNDKYDIIAFNPPYLEKELNNSWISVEDNGAIEEFINNVRSYLNKGGRAYIILSTENNKFEYYKKMLLDWEVINKKTFFFEDIFLYRLKKQNF